MIFDDTIFTMTPSTIWRYEMPPEAEDGDVVLKVREGAQLLRVDRSDRSPFAALWFLIPLAGMRETGERDVARTFRVVGTGHPIPAGYRYLGSTPEAALIWHIFEKVAA